MKICISSSQPDLDGNINPMFGRCEYLLIADIKNNEIKGYESVENISAKQTSGAGIAAAKTVAEKNVEAVITGNVGPRAFDVMNQFGIKVYRATGSIRNAIQMFIENRLEEVQTPGEMHANIQSNDSEIKIAVPTNGNNGLSETVAYHFGRCNTYTLLDGSGKVLDVIVNTSEHMGGTGLPPEIMKNNGVTVLLCRGLGPRALDFCREFGIEVYVCQAETVQEMFRLWKSNKINLANKEDVCKEHS